MNRRRRWLVCACLGLACADREETPPASPPREEVAHDETISIQDVELSVQGVLRLIVNAQARLQETGLADENRNGLGEFGGLGELAGTCGVRDGKTLDENLLPPAFRRIETGDVSVLGYRFRVALPTKRGWVWERSTGGFAPDTVDAAAAEKRWVAYAWPADFANSGGRAFAIDERRRLFTRSGNIAVETAAALDETWLELP